MTEKTVLDVAQFVLPFSVLSENRKETFTEELERTAIFCFAELERAKGGGLILKQPVEKLAYIAKFHYPFWLAPWGTLNLLFDGLGRTAHTLNYQEVPDTKTFTKSIERSSKTLEAYTAFLSDNVNYFQPATGAKGLTINGLITDANLLNEFKTYLPEASQLETRPAGTATLSPTTDEAAVSSMIDELENMKLKFKEEIEALYVSMKLLNKTTRNFVRTIRGKIKAVKEEFGEEIREQEAIVTPKVNRLNEEYDEAVAKLTKDFEKQLLPVQKEKVKLEKTREQTLGKIERYKIEAKTSASNKDAIGEKKWKEKVNDTKRELSEVEAKIKEHERRIKEIEENRSLETFRIRGEWEAKVNEAKKDLLELEASRDAKVQLHTQEIEKLERLSSAITEQIGKMAKSREASVDGLEKLGIEQKHEQNALSYVPFYLVGYQSDSKRRYVLFPPSVANSVSLLTKLKGVLGRTKVKQLLVPRFKALTPYLSGFPSMIERSAVFEREINEAGEKANIMKPDSLREQIRDGLKQLKGEGWLSEKEHAALHQKLS